MKRQIQHQIILETLTTTNDNSDTNQDNTDSGDDGMIDPVGTDGGVTIPEDSSIFMDGISYHSYRYGHSERNGEWCGGERYTEIMIASLYTIPKTILDMCTFTQLTLMPI